MALVKGVSEGIGIQRMAEAWGVLYGLVGLCDSTAAIGIVNRKGVGRIRHLEVGKLWIQELREDGGLEVKKVKGTANVADQCTKYLNGGEVERGVEMLGMQFRGGRAERAMEVVKGWGGMPDGRGVVGVGAQEGCQREDTHDQSEGREIKPTSCVRAPAEGEGVPSGLMTRDLFPRVPHRSYHHLAQAYQIKLACGRKTYTRVHSLQYQGSWRWSSKVGLGGG